jgi:WD40 repeat protein
VWEAYQFLLQHQPLIQDSALQTYSAALAFTPKDSLIFEGYRKKYAAEMPVVSMTTPIRWTTHNVLTGHLKHVDQVEFSPNGNRLATTARDSTLRLWDTESGAVVGYPFEASKSESIVHLAFSNNSERIAFATRSCKIYVWNAETGKRILFFSEPHAGELVQLGFSPTHPIIIAAFRQSQSKEIKFHNAVRMWSSLDGTKIGETMQLDAPALCFAISPDGLRIAIVSKREGFWKDGVASLWSLESYSKITEYLMPEVYCHPCVSYSPAGNRFVTWDQNGKIYLRDGFTGDPIECDNKHEKRVIKSYFSPNGAYMASYGDELPVFLWDAITGALRYKLTGHTRHPRYIAFSLDGARLASISLDQTIRVWEVESGASMQTFFTGHTGNVSHPVLSADWTKLVTVSIANQINLYDVNAGTMRGYETEEGDMNFAIPTVAFSPNGEHMVCGYSDLDNTCDLGLWSTVTCDSVGVPMRGHTNGIVSVAFSPNGNLVASLSKDNTARLWYASNGYAVGEPLAFRDGKQVLFSPDGHSVASSSTESIQVWDINSRKTIWKSQRKSRSCSIAFFPNQTRLVSGMGTKIGTWDLSTGLSTPSIVTSEIESDFDILAIGPRSDVFATSDGREIRLWRVTDIIQMVAELSVRPKLGFQLGISSDGAFLAYGSSVWNMSTLETPEPLQPPQLNRSILDWGNFPNSLLIYEDGWICSPSGPLLPIPGQLSGQFHHWFTFGWKVVCWTQEWTPVVIDCSPLMKRSDEQS